MPKHSAAAILFHAVDFPPFRPRHTRNVVVLGQRLVHERIVGVEDFERTERSSSFEQLLKEQGRLLEQRFAQRIVERRKQLLVFLPIVANVPHVQPLRAELGRQPTHPAVAQHPVRLG